MANILTFQTQIASVMEVLANAAVAEICKLVEDSYAELHLEISQTKNENILLKKKLKTIEIRDSFYRRAHKLMSESTSMTRTNVSVNEKVSGRISLKVSSVCNVGSDEEGSVHRSNSLLQPERLDQSVGSDEPDVFIVKEERPDNMRCEQSERETDTAENLEDDAQCQSAEVFVTVHRENNIDQNTIQHCHPESVGEDEPDVLIIKEERPDNIRCEQSLGETKTVGNHDTQYMSAGSFVAVHRENFIDQDTVQHCHQEPNEMQPDLLEDENPEMYDRGEGAHLLNGETRMERGCEEEAETNPQPIPSYASWVSRRLDVTTNHPPYGESECNGGPSVNPFLMYRGSADPMCSYAAPIDANGLSMPDIEGHLTQRNGGNNISQSEQPPFTSCFSFKQSHSPQMQRKDKFVCKHCGRAFSQPSTLHLHQKLHTRERLHNCTLCGKRFSQASSLKRHHSIHRGEKPFRCLHCGKQFSDQSNLKKHVTVHTGEKPYGCNLCGKMFNQSSNLKTHMKIHTREKPFGCDRCGRMFAHKYILVKHQQKICATTGQM
ncbi:zinc finger protein 773 [Pimephales promelas]|uniref:zinc finger protein 773 n=1 Tax=Pimephales promelas TaxID=90988 RepID=UPI0019558A69|nr:zinc finger protein 773 [Pimephales promelas]KAG1956339.1 gastrula zinc finger protein XlCGF8.2DB-like [Pimephales promelas]